MAEDADSVTLTGPEGLRVTLPGFYRAAPERATAQMPLVAVAELGDDSAGFAPTVTVEVDSSTPALMGIEAHSVAAISRQLARGRHIVAVDPWSLPGQADGRRVVSIHPKGEETLLEFQYLAIRSGRALTLTVLVLGSAHRLGLEVFEYVAGTLEWVAPVPPAASAVAAMPAMDEDAAGRGVDLEFLGDIPSRQGFHSDSARLDPEDVRALRANRSRSRRGRDTLVRAGWTEADGGLTLSGGRAHELLAKASANLITEVTVPGRDRHWALQALLGAGGVAVLADPPPGEAGEGRTLDLIPALTLPVTLIRWLGLAPAWNLAPAAPPDREVTIARALWQARLTDPQTAAPRGASPEFERLWDQPWQVATVQTSKRWRNGPGSLQYLSTPEAGYVLIIPDAHGRFVRLESRPPAQLLHALFVVSGLIDRREPQ